MKYLPLLLLAALSTGVFAQRHKNNDEVLNNVKTSSHVNLPGTKAYIILPDGFDINIAPQNNGQGNPRIIFAREEPGVDFSKATQNMVEMRGNSSFYQQLKYKELTINGYAAKMTATEISSTLNYTLAFGNADFCVTISCILKDDDKAGGKLVEKALQTVYYDTATVLNLFAPVPFALDESQSMFKFAEKVRNKYEYSVDGEKVINYEAIPSFSVNVLGYKPKELHIPIDAPLTMLKHLEVKNVSEDSLNGSASLKRELYGQLNNTNYMLYQQVVVLGNNTIVMVGIATTDFDKYLAEFKKLAATLHKK